MSSPVPSELVKRSESWAQNYVPGEKKDLYIKSIQRTVLCMGRRQDSIDDVPAGNTVACVGLDQFIQKNATITDESDVEAHTIKAMKFSVSPVVRVAVECKNSQDLPKLVEGLKRLSKSDPMVQCSIEESGEHIVAGAGELHLEICLKDLQEDFMGGAEIRISDPVVSFRETVLGTSDHMVMSKSPNKHNRLYFQATPLEDGLSEAIDNGDVTPRDEVKARGRLLAEKWNWDKDLSKKIWCFGPDTTGPNLIVDMCKGFNTSTKSRIRASPPSNGRRKKVSWLKKTCAVSSLKFTTLSCTRMPSTEVVAKSSRLCRRVLYAACLTAQPRLYEPVYLVEIQAPEQALGGIYSTVTQKRGMVVEETQRPGTPIYNIKAYLPVMESFGFTGTLRAATGGQAFPQCVFDHWDMLGSDPLDPTTQAGKIICDIRKRKGLKDAIPPLGDYEDRL